MVLFEILQDQLLYALRLVATSLFTLFMGFLIGKILGRTLYCLFLHSGLDNFSKSLPIKFSPTHFFSQLVIYLIDVIAIILALNVLNLAFKVFFVIMGIAILASVTGGLFWLKDILINTTAKICLFLKKVKLSSGQKFSLYTHAINGTIQTTSTTALILQSGNDIYEIPYVMVKP